MRGFDEPFYLAVRNAEIGKQSGGNIEKRCGPICMNGTPKCFSNPDQLAKEPALYRMFADNLVRCNTLNPRKS